jgi:hypothetical protein
MKNPISRFLFLGAAVATLALTNGCSPQKSSAQSQSAATSVISAPSAPTAPMVAPEIPAVTSTPATMPANILPTSPLAQVVRLTQAGVDQGIIMVYVTNSSRTFNLDSDKIIYLSDLGLPTELVTAMMQHDQFLQQQFAAVQAEQQAQQAQQAQQTQPAQTAPAPDPAVANTAEQVTTPAPVAVNYFNDTLSPYGSWVVVNGYGRCWRPTACVYDSSWQPYCDRGHWVYTDCGWYWSSDYAWGATFHYGRWFRDTSIGWCWYPDNVWAPSWVTWRYSNNYCGWAPLPPRTFCQAGVGIVYQGGGVNVGFSFGLGASCFTFVPTQYFCNSHPRNYRAAPGQATQIYNNTTVINNIRIHGSGNNQIIINNGIPVQNVASSTQTPIRPVPVHQIDRAFAHSSSGQPTDRSAQVFTGDRPRFTGNANSSAPSSVPAHAEPAASMTVQNPPQSTSPAGSGNSHPTRIEPPSPNRIPQPVKHENPQVGSGQFNQVLLRSQPGNNPATTVPQGPAPANYHSPAYVAPVQIPPANFNYNPQPVPSRWQQSGTPHNYTRNPEVRQNINPQSQLAPPMNYSASPQPQPQPRGYGQPRNEVRQYNSPSSIVAAPQPSSPNAASSPQLQGGGRMGNQNWPMH